MLDPEARHVNVDSILQDYGTTGLWVWYVGVQTGAKYSWCRVSRGGGVYTRHLVRPTATASTPQRRQLKFDDLDLEKGVAGS